MDKKDIVELTKKVYKLTLLFPKKEPLRYKIREVANEVLAELVILLNLDSFNRGDIGQERTKERDIIFSAKNNLEIIDSYFEIAKWQNWLSYFDILETQEEYAKIKENLIKEISRTEMQESLDFDLFARREEIAEALSQPAIKFPIRELRGDKESKRDIWEKGEKWERREIGRAREREENGLKLNSRKEKILKVLEKVGRIQVGEINKLFPEVCKRTIRRDFHKLLEEGIVERLGEKNNTFYKIKSQNI